MDAGRAISFVVFLSWVISKPKIVFSFSLFTVLAFAPVLFMVGQMWVPKCATLIEVVTC